MSGLDEQRRSERDRLTANLAAALAEIPNLSLFSRETGIDRRALTRYASGEMEPAATTLIRMARGLNVSVDRLAGVDTPQGGNDEPQGSAQGLLKIGSLMPGSGDIAMIPRVNIRHAAAIESGEGPEVERVPFSRAQLQRLGIGPQHARLVQADGDGMAGTIADKDDVLIDAGDRSPTSEGIYAVILGEIGTIKRVQAHLGSITLLSDNSRYAPIPIGGDQAAQLRVLGRARLVMRAL